MPDRLTDTELDELIRLEREATERTASTWTTTRFRGDGAHLVAFVLPASDFRTRAIAETADQEEAVFIATARNAVPRLIAEVRELRAERAWVVKVEADARADERAKVEREIVVHLHCLANLHVTAKRYGDADVLREAIGTIERGEHRR